MGVFELTYWHWYSACIAFCIVEILLGANFFLLWLGISAAVVGLLLQAHPEMTWEIQFIIFSGLSLSCIFAWFYYLKHNPSATDRPFLNKRMDKYIGKNFYLITDIQNGNGKVKIDGVEWRVQGPDLREGSVVKVVGVEGIVLLVEQLVE